MRGLFLLLFAVAIHFSSEGQAANAPQGASCGVELAGFEKEWSRRLSLYPTPTHLAKGRLKEVLLSIDTLPATFRTHLQKGGDPLAGGDRAMIRALGAAYRKAIVEATMGDKVKEKLLASLDRAIAELLTKAFEEPIPAEGGGGGGVEDPNGPPPPPGGGGIPTANASLYDEKITKLMEEERLKRCVVRGTILFFVSSFITAVTALQAKWKEYAGPENRPLIEKVVDGNTWNRAWSDRHFRHNITWNSILMVALGALSCMKNKERSYNLTMAVTAATSMIGQYFTNGKIELRQTLVDVFWVRVISINKMEWVFKYSEGYNGPAPRLVEAGLQLLSEGFGGVFYPRFNELTVYLTGGEEPKPEEQLAPQ